MEVFRAVTLVVIVTTAGALGLRALLGGPSLKARGFLSRDEWVCGSFFTGYLAVTWLAYPLSAGFGIPVGLGSLSLLGVAVALALAAFRGNRPAWPKWKAFRSPDLSWAAGLIVVGFVYFQNYSANQAVSSFCLKDNIRLLLDPPADFAYLFRVVVGDQREGGPAFASGVMGSLADPLTGARLTFAFCGMTIAAFTTLTARRLLTREWVSIAAGLGAAFHPYLFRLPGLDENLFSLAVTSFVVFVLATALRPLLPIAGFGAAFAFNIRHEDLLFLPAIAFFVARRHGVRALPAILIPFFIGIAPTLARHAVAMGSLFAYESFIQHAGTFPHQLMEWRFALPTPLNFPFYPEVVRTPLNPYPGALMLPLIVARYSGYAFITLALAGALVLLRRDRTAGAFSLIWIGPMWLVLSLIEHWDYPSKMSIPVVMLNPVFLWFACGLDWVAGVRLQPLRLVWLALAGAFVVAVVSGLRAIPSSAFPADPRYLAHYGCPVREDPAVLAMQRQWLLEVPILPVSDWASLVRGVASPPASLSRWEWEGHMPWLTPAALAWARDSLRLVGRTPALVRLDVASGPSTPDRMLSVSRGVDPDAIVLDERPRTLRVNGLSVPWTTRPVRMEVSWSPREAILWVRLSDCDADRVETFCASCSPSARRESDVRRERESLGHRDSETLDRNRVEQRGVSFRLSLPVHVVILDVVNEWADWMVASEGVLGLDGFRPVARSLPVSN